MYIPVHGEMISCHLPFSYLEVRGSPFGSEEIADSQRFSCSDLFSQSDGGEPLTLSLPLDVNYVCSDRILTFGIRSIRSPAKVGIGCYKAVNYQPGS